MALSIMFIMFTAAWTAAAMHFSPVFNEPGGTADERTRSPRQMAEPGEPLEPHGLQLPIVPTVTGQVAPTATAPSQDTEWITSPPGPPNPGHPPVTLSAPVTAEDAARAAAWAAWGAASDSAGDEVQPDEFGGASASEPPAVTQVGAQVTHMVNTNSPGASASSQSSQTELQQDWTLNTAMPLREAALLKMLADTIVVLHPNSKR